MSRRLVGLSTLMIAFAVLVTGCDSSKKSDVDNLVGTWNWSKLVLKGVTWSPLNPSVYTPGGSTAITPGLIQQLDPNARLSVVITFNENKTVNASLNVNIPGRPVRAESGSGTWSVAGDVLTVNVQDGADRYSASGVFSISGSKMTIAISNEQWKAIILNNGIDLSDLSAADRALVMTLSATIELTK